MEIYAVTFLARKDDFLHTFTDVFRCDKNGIFADSTRQKILEKCGEHFPELDGFERHRFETMKVPQRWIKEAALAAMLEPEQ